MSATKGTGRAGFIGWPAPGMALKLVPLQQKMEARYRGPNITTGFWRQEELTSEVFDEEGFFRSGDAFRFLHPDSPVDGMVFDGRITEDFKLSTGTWVSVGPLRLRFLSHCAPFIKDVVFGGHDRDDITALIFPEWEECRRLLKNAAEVSLDDAVRAAFETLLTTFAESSTGASTRVARAVIVPGSPSFDAGESTDKGTINQRAVLVHRASLVEELYLVSPPPHVLVAGVTQHGRSGRNPSS
jgi:feruloyl-CoA synthase